jgi:hypothetical protein
MLTRGGPFGGHAPSAVPSKRMGKFGVRRVSKAKRMGKTIVPQDSPVNEIGLHVPELLFRPVLIGVSLHQNFSLTCIKF